MNKNIYIIVAIILIVGVGYMMLNKSNIDEQDSLVIEQVGEEMDNIVVVDATYDVFEAAENSNDKIDVLGSYEVYTPETFESVKDDTVVLFFHATWCPSCKVLNSDIEKHSSTIPAGLTILKIDYDEEVTLKRKYGVTTQHTLVQVDSEGEMIKKWSGGTYDTILAQVE